MRRDEHTRAEQQGDGQPENERELEDRGSGAAMSARGGAAGSPAPEPPESGMGGTSDAGTAADDAAEAAAYNRGLPNDLTQQTGRSASEIEQDL
jgi:hypothetical protein